MNPLIASLEHPLSRLMILLIAQILRPLASILIHGVCRIAALSCRYFDFLRVMVLHKLQFPFDFAL